MSINDRTVRRAKDAVNAAKATWGTGWQHLSDEQKKGAIALQVVSILMVQDEEHASPAMQRLQEVANLALDTVEPRTEPGSFGTIKSR